MSTTLRTLTTLMALAALAASPAFAHGRGGGVPSRPTGPSAPHSRGLLGELIFPCQAACSDDAKACVEAAQDTALTCISGACSAEITTAQTACQEDRGSTDCRTAVAALADCGETCLDDFATAGAACRTTLGECREACTAE